MIARIAARQWGLVSARDLRALGLSRQAISKRVAAGRLFPAYRGVWAVGHPNLPLEGRFLAAVLACGPGAVLSHWSAVVHWGLRRWIEHDPHVTSPTKRDRAGIVNHRSDHIEGTVHRGVPVVTPARAICDITATATVKVLRGVVNHALGLELVTLGQLVTYTGRGAKKLRRVLAEAAPTRSENENLVLHLIHDAGLPIPLVNPRLDGTSYIPDFLWPERGLILEADSRRFHGNLIARADDASRQLVLERMGLRVIRTTWREATAQPAVVQRRIANALGAEVV
ncbi:type IV toxin-antitoxin system AbiEi family antitoxin domain-containing protein [Solirubrobacter sp. CPCC 204708]|uniref:Type IV toxin-antitoxin system AbiEi family antitoxin domain-containing protein n=1 Tax=Solirubrobacter deserti TaxID=2282478 RepID=A0ABT4RS63_9ACTN|nr:type IV toxin-antitoxin system AbiEi family antitoxin domain-containing protein [Solirubrobacter deserti]MBE2319879.1 type IV toxin-antitoxin system AbiEi family antitoxin domain-containing protein [Solirubrobacter deserti]MDA0141412.1 type IV toxin-antitoxin system AbiEi family antitoxin domain-containing protein [Solirubrobacter deserti]